jgi:predicted DNA-binding transcriptional regulator AlpA
MSRLLTVAELAECWQVPTGWIYAKCRTGELPKVPLPGKYVRFRLDVVEAFERGECTRTTQPEEVA